jgi:carboxyl-terminal processing protease
MFAGACLLTLVPICAGSAFTTFTDSPKAIVDEVWQIINTEYVDGTFNHSDWQKTRTKLLQRKYNNRQEAYTAIRSSLKQLGDKYTRFMNPQEFQSLNTQTSGEVSGVGIKMGANPRTQQLVVVATVKNSPAAKAGIKPGDAIVAIDGKSTLNISDGAIALILGETGKSIIIKIARGKMKPFDIALTRAPLEVASVFTRVKQEGKLKVGYIKLLEFSANSASQMETAIKDLNRQKVNAYVLDLRDNPGGLVHICIQMARMWLDNETIVKTVDRQGNSDIFRADGEPLT